MKPAKDALAKETKFKGFNNRGHRIDSSPES